MVDYMEFREELYDISNGLNSVHGSEPEIIESQSTIIHPSVPDLIANQNMRKAIPEKKVIFEYDISTTNPLLKIDNETYNKILIHRINELIDENSIEIELNVLVAPTKSYEIEVEIKNIKKGELKFIDPFQ